MPNVVLRVPIVISSNLVRSLMLLCLMSLAGSARSGVCGEGVRCVWAFGNSITKHGPAPKLDWTGDWGMAATSADLDYVNQLAELLAGSERRQKWSGHRENVAQLEESPNTFRLPTYLSRFAKQADIVVLELGDNFSPKKFGIEEFAAAYLDLAKAVKPENGTLVCVSTWWASANKNLAILKSCNAAGGMYVDVSDLNKVPVNLAGNQRKLKDAGVAAHPSDLGMRAIAERIYYVLPDHQK